jgi:hypothetical protein
VARVEHYGRERLAAATRSRTWPAGLAVEVSEDAWLPLLSVYGDGPLFALIESIRADQMDAPGALHVAIDYDPARPTGTALHRDGSARVVRISLGAARDERDAQLQLAAVERHVLAD